MVHEALALAVPDLPQLLSLRPPAGLSDCHPRLQRLLLSRRQQKISVWGKGDLQPLSFSYGKCRTGLEHPFMYPSFLCLRRAMAHEAQVLWGWIFFPAVNLLLLCCQNSLQDLRS